MNWKMMDLAARQLNADALNQWKDAFLSMSIWMQAILVGVLVLLIGASVLSCWWGFRMNRSARFLAGAASVFFIVVILLTTEYPQENWKALLIAAAAGVGGGFLYAFLERAFQFVAGFVSRVKNPDFDHVKLAAGRHQAHFHPGPDRPFLYPDKADCPAVIVVERVKNQCLQRSFRIALRCGNMLNNRFEDLLDVHSCFG